MKELFLELNKDAKEPLYVQLYQQIKEKITSGDIPCNSSLPSIRNLSKELHINKITVETAYDQLLMEGYIESTPRSGYYVREIELQYFYRQSGHRSNVLPKAPWRDAMHRKTPGVKYEFDFDLNHIDTKHFPLATWRKLSNQCLLEEHQDVFFTGNPQGEHGLRKEIARYLHSARGVVCNEDQIIIGSHSQYLIQLVCQMIQSPNKIAAVGEPGYNLITRTFEASGYEIAPVRVESDGLCQEQLRKSRAGIVFAAPSHQFPFGNPMSIQKRIALLEWAAETGAYVIEDDYLSEYRYSGAPIPSLQGLDRSQRVIYMGTFHATLLPSIRIAYIILPPPLSEVYYDRYDYIQQTTSRIHQKTLELFMRQGHWERHILRMKRVYEKKYHGIIETVERVFQDKAEILGGKAGLHIVLQVHSTQDESALLAKAKAAGIRVFPMSETWYRKENNTQSGPSFMLGFGGLTREAIVEGIQMLYECWFGD